MTDLASTIKHSDIHSTQIQIHSSKSQHLLPMENSDWASSIPKQEPLSVIKENLPPVSPKIAELKESREELVSRIQKLKLDLQSWRTKLDTQVKVYHDELSELKKSLNTEVDQLRTEFQELKTTLQQQQEDVTASLRNLGLPDDMGVSEEAEGPRDVEENKNIVEDPSEDHNRKDTHE